MSVGELCRRERGMAGTTPTVRGELLTWRTAGIDHVLRVGSADWFTWLEGATSFAYGGAGGRFTARKEQRQRGGWYWKAYRKLAGKLHRVYLGKTADLTAARLAAAATTLAELAVPVLGTTPPLVEGRPYRSGSPQRDAAAILPAAGERLVSFVAVRRLATEFPPFISTAPASDGAMLPFRPLLATKLTPPPP